MKTLLVKDRGYKWLTLDGISFKGYFVKIGDESVYTGEHAVSYLKTINSFAALVGLLKEIDGCFSIIINRDKYTLTAVDRARSMPLYFSNEYISDSAEEIRKVHGIEKDAVDKDAFLELASNTFIIGNRTVYPEIKQLDLGEAALFEGTNVDIRKYFYHINKISDVSADVIKKKLTETAYNTFRRIKNVIAGRPVVLSMSGGYDSRFVGCMLKNVGIEDVSCYSYGRRDSFEVKQSRKNAESLGFRWKYVEMTDELMDTIFDKTGQEFINYFTGHDYTAYLQNFLAVRQLHEEGWFKPGSVFLTGLCGDMPTGEYIKPEDYSVDYNMQSLLSSLYKSLFNSFDMGIDYENKWKDQLKQQIDKIPLDVKDYQSWQSVYDCIYTGTCHTRAYMHMNAAHSFFGYEWLLPYWDVELLKYWYSVPAKYKVGQRLYEDWLLNEICQPYGIGQKKTVCLYSQSYYKKKVLYFCGGIVVYVLLHLGIPFRRKQDFNNFAPVELSLFRQIKSKDCVYYQKSGIVHMLCHYLLEKRYGVDNYRYFYNHTKIFI